MTAKKRSKKKAALNAPAAPNNPITIQSARQQLNIVVDLIPIGHSNRPGTPLSPRKITIHNTDNDSPGADARAHAQYQKGTEAQQRQVSWHFTVDDRSVYQSLPVNEVGWHAGTHAGNYQSIGIEICENRGIDQQAANDRAALLAAAQLHELNIPLGNVVQHFDWSTKDCPALLRHPSSNWTAFLQRVQDFYNRFDLDRHEHHHPMIAMPAGFAAPALKRGVHAPMPGTPSIVLSWEDGSHPSRKQWSQQLTASVQQYKSQLDLGTPDGFVTGYGGLPPDGQIKFWCELLIAMSKFESSWNPNEVFQESDGQDSVGLFQLSVGDQNNYALTPHVHSEQELKDPFINIQWAVPILAHWTAHDRVVATGVAGDNRGGARYWSVLRGGPSHHYLEIQTLTKAHSGLA
jgi:N-acetylmuramoyl-L-alanine amidase/Transglycosylase SLT domain